MYDACQTGAMTPTVRNSDRAIIACGGRNCPPPNPCFTIPSTTAIRTKLVVITASRDLVNHPIDADGVLLKPFGLNDLLGEVSKLVGRA